MTPTSTAAQTVPSSTGSNRLWVRGVRPPRGGLIPPENAHVAACEQPLGRRGVARDRPDASLQIHAGMAVRMHPGDAAVVAAPGGMPAGAGIDMHLALHVRCLCHGCPPWPTVFEPTLTLLYE